MDILQEYGNDIKRGESTPTEAALFMLWKKLEEPDHVFLMRQQMFMRKNLFWRLLNFTIKSEKNSRVTGIPWMLIW